MRKLRTGLSFANVMSVLAVFIALGGTSYAISKLPKNSVGTRQLKKNSVTGQKVKDGSLTGRDIDAKSLGNVPFADKAAIASQANTAQNAATATNATQATSAGNGAVRIDWSGSGSNVRPSATILALDELTLSAWCEDPNGAKEADYIEVFSTATKPGTVGTAFHWAEEFSSGTTDEYFEFKAGEEKRLVNQRSYFGDTGTQDGQMIFRFDDRVITVLLLARADSVTHECQVNGIAFAAPG